MDLYSPHLHQVRQAEAPPSPADNPYHGQLAPRAVGSVVVLTVFLVITLIFTALRIQARWLSVRRLFSSDYVFLAAEVVYIAYSVVSYVSLIDGGIGFHVVDLGPAKVTLILKLLLVIQITYALCMCLLKISICLLYNHIFTQRWVRWCSYGIMVLSVCWAAFTILNGLLICRPLSALWIPGTGTCGNENAGYSAVSGIELGIDAFIILLPLPVVWRLNTTTVAKLATSSLFCLGLITIVVTGVRLHATLSVNFADFSYSSISIYDLTVVELGVAVMVTSGMGLRPIVERAVRRSRRWLGLSSRGDTQKSYADGTFPMHTNVTTVRSARRGSETLIEAQQDDDLAKFHALDDRADEDVSPAEDRFESGTDLTHGQGVVVTKGFYVQSEKK